MSQFLPEQKSESSKGPESYLSGEERKELQRMLSFPEDLPAKFKSFLIDFIAVNIPQIPISQITGFNQFDASTDTQGAEANGTVATGSGTYVELSGGPEITGLSAGLYVVHYGASIQSDNIGVSHVNVSVNGATPSDDYALTVTNQGTTYWPLSRARLVTISADGGEIAMVYKMTAFTLRASRRWLVVQKYANVSGG